MLSFSTFDVQCRVASLGFDPGPLDGILGTRTKNAVNAARAARGIRTVGAPYGDLFHSSGLHRIVLHWTAGAYGTDESSHYHAVVDERGDVELGYLKPEANAYIGDGNYVPHTLGLNTGSIGLAVKAMGLAVERPFSAGEYPITEAQLDAFVDQAAEFCMVYDIPVHPISVLTHAEVQSTLGKRQRQKWDITVLPGLNEPKPAREVGDLLRGRIGARLAEIAA